MAFGFCLQEVFIASRAPIRKPFQESPTLYSAPVIALGSSFAASPFPKPDPSANSLMRTDPSQRAHLRVKLPLLLHRCSEMQFCKGLSQVPVFRILTPLKHGSPPLRSKCRRARGIACEVDPEKQPVVFRVCVCLRRKRDRGSTWGLFSIPSPLGLSPPR